MSLESFMLKDEVKEVEYVASNRFVDKEGKVEKWKLKTITADENDAIRKQCYKQVQVGKRMKQEFDTVKYLELLADKCVVYPDLHNVELQDFYNEMDSIKLLKKHLLNPGEYDDLMQEIQALHVLQSFYFHLTLHDFLPDHSII